VELEKLTVWDLSSFGTDRLSRNVGKKLPSTERKIPQGHIFYLHHGGSLKRAKLTVVRFVKISPTCYAAQKFMTLLTTAHHWSKTSPTSHPPRPLGSLYYYYYYYCYYCHHHHHHHLLQL